MFNIFKKKKAETQKPKNLKLISLCLAFEVANADDAIDSREKEIILDRMRNSLDLSILTEKEIFEVIKEESDKKVSF